MILLPTQQDHTCPASGIAWRDWLHRYYSYLAGKPRKPADIRAIGVQAKIRERGVYLAAQGGEQFFAAAFEEVVDAGETSLRRPISKVTICPDSELNSLV